MTRATDSQLVASLSGLSEGLKADGYVVDARWSDEGRVAITIDATPEACADCLVPRNVMRSIAVAMLKDAEPALTEQDVDITYPVGSKAH